MLDKARIEDMGKHTIGPCSLDGIPLHNPQYRSKDFVHALSISDLIIHFAENEKDVEHHILRRWLPEVYIIRHASFNILVYLRA